MEDSIESPQKLRIELPQESAVSLLDINPKKKKPVIWKDIYTPMFTAVLFTIVKIWKQLKCPSMDEWIKEDTHTHTHTQWNSTQSQKKRWNLAFCDNMDLGRYGRRRELSKSDRER